MENIAILKNQMFVTKIFSYDYFNSFLKYADVKESTMKGYKNCLKQFFLYLNEQNIKQPEREDIYNYKKYLNEQNFTAGTKAQYLRAVKQFFSWLESEDLYKNIAKNIKGVKTDTSIVKKEAFNEEDIKTIINSIDTTTEQGARNKAIILLAVTCGLRLIEINRADIQDIQILRGQPIIYIQGKGREDKSEYKKIIPEVYTTIKEYLEKRSGYTNISPLFCGTSNRAKNDRITVTSLSRIIKTIFRESGFDSNKLTAHSLRHTSNTLLFKAGADLYTVQKHARHKDPKTTEIYIHINEAEQMHSEQDIYNQIYNKHEQETTKELNNSIEKLTEAEKIKVLEFIKNIKKGE